MCESVPPAGEECRKEARIPDPPSSRPDDEDISGLLQEDPLGSGAEELLAGQGRQMEALEGMNVRVESLQEQLCQVNRSLEALTGEHRALTLANEQVNRQGELHWEEHIVQPLVTQLFPLVDLVLGFRAAERARAGGKNERDSAFKAIQTMLDDFLATYGIECFVPRVREVFDPVSMKAVKVMATDVKALHNHVQGTVQAGFRRGRTVLKPASVVLLRQEKPGQPPRILTEGVRE